jgi:hypothetical protein
MKREYLLKVIEKHFFVLSKEEIAEQIKADKLDFPDFLVNALETQDACLDDANRLKIINPYFCDAISDVRERINNLRDKQLTVWGKEKLFDNTLLLISVYYHYSAVSFNNVMADFIRLVLLEKVLLT